MLSLSSLRSCLAATLIAVPHTSEGVGQLVCVVRCLGCTRPCTRGWTVLASATIFWHLRVKSRASLRILVGDTPSSSSVERLFCLRTGTYTFPYRWRVRSVRQAAHRCTLRRSSTGTHSANALVALQTVPIPPSCGAKTFRTDPDSSDGSMHLFLLVPLGTTGTGRTPGLLTALTA